jgi:hypothetical protein
MNIFKKIYCRSFQTVFKLAGYADKEANPLYPVPVLMDAKTLEQFYYKLMKDNTRENEV